MKIHNSIKKELGISNFQNNDLLHIDTDDNNNIISIVFSRNNYVKIPDVFGNIKSLKKLDLSHNNFSDISILSGLENLTYLDLSYNNIVNLKPLSSLKKLTTLIIDSNYELKDIQALSSLTKLERLNIKDTKVNNLLPLSPLKRLYKLDVTKNTVITGFSNLLNIEYVPCFIKQTKVDLNKNSFEMDYSNKEYEVALHGNTFFKIPKMNPKTNFLDLSDNSIRDISELITYKELIGLKISNNPIQNIKILGELKQLVKLTISNIKNIDLTFLYNIKKITHLSLNSNQITDISFLKYLKNLEYLSLNSNQISDISFLKYLKNLKYLDLSNNEITDISKIKNLDALEYLNLKYNKVVKYSELKHLQKLNFLDLSHNLINHTDILFFNELDPFKMNKPRMNEKENTMIPSQDKGCYELNSIRQSNTFDRLLNETEEQHKKGWSKIIEIYEKWIYKRLFNRFHKINFKAFILFSKRNKTQTLLLKKYSKDIDIFTSDYLDVFTLNKKFSGHMITAMFEDFVSSDFNLPALIILNTKIKKGIVIELENNDENKIYSQLQKITNFIKKNYTLSDIKNKLATNEITSQIKTIIVNGDGNIVIADNSNSNLDVSQQNKNNMEFHDSTFLNCTFNEYKSQVIQTLQNNNQFGEIDVKMFEAIDQYGKDEQEKKELVQAVSEVKSEKAEKEKKPFKDRLVNFLKNNKEVFKTVLKIGVSAVIGHYGLQGADNLIGLE